LVAKLNLNLRNPEPKSHKFKKEKAEEQSYKLGFFRHENA